MKPFKTVIKSLVLLTSEVTFGALQRLQPLVCADVKQEVVLGFTGVGADVTLELSVLCVDAHVVRQAGFLAAYVVALWAGICGQRAGIVKVLAIHH